MQNKCKCTVLYLEQCYFELKHWRLFHYKSTKNKDVYLITSGIFCIFEFIVRKEQSDYFSKREKCGLEIRNLFVHNNE
jgi:hypothetical protein